MAAQALDLHGARVFLCATDGPMIASDRDTSDLVGEAIGSGAGIIAIPLARLPVHAGQ